MYIDYEYVIMMVMKYAIYDAYDYHDHDDDNHDDNDDNLQPDIMSRSVPGVNQVVNISLLSLCYLLNLDYHVEDDDI